MTRTYDIVYFDNEGLAKLKYNMPVQEPSCQAHVQKATFHEISDKLPFHLCETLFEAVQNQR